MMQTYSKRIFRWKSIVLMLIWFQTLNMHKIRLICADCWFNELRLLVVLFRWNIRWHMNSIAFSIRICGKCVSSLISRISIYSYGSVYYSIISNHFYDLHFIISFSMICMRKYLMKKKFNTKCFCNNLLLLLW